jgi:two-component system response regulator YesN
LATLAASAGAGQSLRLPGCNWYYSVCRRAMGQKKEKGLGYLISKAKFGLLSKKYFKKTGLPLILVDLSGEIVFELNKCSLCKKLLGREDTISKKNCRLMMVKAVEEAFRWGEGYITSCPVGMIMFAVPIIHKQKLRGGFVSGFAILPEMRNDILEEIQDNLKEYGYSARSLPQRYLKLKVFSPRKVREDVSYLLRLTREFHINDLIFLQTRREKYVQQFKIANFLDELKKSTTNISKKILGKEDEIIQKVKLGDKAGAREILNEFLGSIFFESGMNFEIIKVRILELVVIISRAAMEAGVEARDLLGLNYSYLTELNKATDLDELLLNLTDILENFIARVSSIKDKKRKVRTREICEFIEKTFTKKIAAVDVAKAGGLSVSRALHLIKEETGLSLSGYVNKLRIDYGKYLILNTGVSLADVAIEAGFYDQSHFTRSFKKSAKMTPFHFRQKYKTSADLFKHNPRTDGQKEEGMMAIQPAKVRGIRDQSRQEKMSGQGRKRNGKII